MYRNQKKMIKNQEIVNLRCFLEPLNDAKSRICFTGEKYAFLLIIFLKLQREHDFIYTRIGSAQSLVLPRSTLRNHLFYRGLRVSEIPRRSFDAPFARQGRFCGPLKNV